jgi:TonB family protein
MPAHLEFLRKIESSRPVRGVATARLWILVVGFAAVCAHQSCAAETKATASASSPSDDKSRLHALWADNPEYEAALTASHYTVPPIPTYQKPPVPPSILTPGMSAKVTVSFIVDEIGNVAAARVLESTDPRFNQSALDAVQTWKFKPAEDNSAKVKSFLIIPIAFDGGPPADQRVIISESSRHGTTCVGRASRYPSRSPVQVPRRCELRESS